MNLPKTLNYTKTHEWAQKNGTKVLVGLTDYAQKEISDVVFVDLPKPGGPVIQGKAIAVVGSVKAAFDIYAPVSDKIVKTNPALESNPALVNQDCYGDGWLVEIEMTDPSEWRNLMSPEAYSDHLKQEAQ